MRNEMKIWALAALTVAALAGCVKDKSTEPDSHELGTPIRFGASTEWENAELTRTEYSGRDERDNLISSGSQYERIDWVSGKDRIRILCKAATGGTLYDGTGDDYVLGTPASDGRYSNADVEPCVGHGLQWGTGDHCFYAFYPAVGTESNYAFTRYNPVKKEEANIEHSGLRAKVTAVIPSVQEAIRESGTNNFKPNMNLAYMYAAKRVDASDASGGISLTFEPLVTTLEFTLKEFTGNAITQPLTRIELLSKATPLAGTFNATLAVGADPVVQTVGSTSNTISITLPGSGVVLSDDPLKVTFLTLPVEQKDLVLILSFGSDYSLKRTLELKDANLVSVSNPDGWITVGARKKVYISNVAVPGGDLWIYTLDVTGNYSTSVPMAGGNVDYTVSSYRTNSFTSVREQVTWTTQYSVDGGDWTSTCPTWLEGFTMTGPGSTSSPWEPNSATLPANDEPMVWEGSTTPVATTQASARDLSCYDIYGNFTGGEEGTTPYNTANCYVVGAPGWYRIPCVYGNAIKDGADNPSAYTGPATGSNIMTGGFLNHADAHITSPWIKDNPSGTSAGSPNIEIDGAALVWQDHSGLISQVVYDSDYLYFYVDPANIFQGNALLAVKSGNTIIWSWHIWVVNNPETRLTTKLLYSHPSVNQSVVNPMPVLPMSLGFCDSAYGAVRSRYVKVKFIQLGSNQERIVTINQLGEISYNVTYYQWGRKDPMVPGIIDQTLVNQDKPIFNLEGTSITRPASVPGRASIGLGIRSPNVFFVGTSSSKYNWTYRYDNLWNMNETVGVSQYAPSAWQMTENYLKSRDVIVSKTIYDPSPSGFKLPNCNAFTGFSISGKMYPQTKPWNTGPDLTEAQAPVEDFTTYTTLYGFYFYLDQQDYSKGTLFMPRTGSRMFDTGDVAGVRSYTDHLTAAPTLQSNNGAECVLYFTYGRNYIIPYNIAYRAYAMPVRPIGE